jgi:membrane protein required for beta-lactamase induction
MSHSLEDIIDRRYPVGTTERAAFDISIAALHRRHERLDRCFRWLSHIPFVGWLAYVFWYAVVDEGYGALDMVAFHYLADAYVPMRDDLRHRRFKMGRGYRKVGVREVLSEMRRNGKSDWDDD